MCKSLTKSELESLEMDIWGIKTFGIEKTKNHRYCEILIDRLERLLEELRE